MSGRLDDRGCGHMLGARALDDARERNRRRGVRGMIAHRHSVMIVRGVRVCTALPVLYPRHRSEEHTSELQSLMRISYAVFCLKKKTKQTTNKNHQNTQHHS